MASQSSTFPSSAFSITTPFKNVRLMEVPVEVLDIVMSSEKPLEATQLQFKSSPVADTTATTSNASSESKKLRDGVLHLCSHDKTWAIKQVSTSNSVYLIQPTSSSNTSDDLHQDGDVAMEEADGTNNDDTKAITEAGCGRVSAVSQVSNFLELQSVRLDESEIISAIVQYVPLYEFPSSNHNGVLSQSQQLETKSIRSLLADIPAPDSIILKCSARICLFEQDDSTSESKCYIPTSTTLLYVWSKIIEGCSIESVKLDGAIDAGRIANVLDDDVDKAIALCLFRSQGTFETLGLLNSTADTPATLKPRETCIFIAELMLQANTRQHVSNDSHAQQPGSIDVDVFLQKWADLLPTSFVKHCDLEILIRSQLISTVKDLQDREVVKWSGVPVPYLVSSDVTAFSDTATTHKEDTSTATIVTTAATATGKRKWHEKFGAQRNAKK